MRLWHYKLIPSLPRQQLLGQHREYCALRGKGWGKKHSTVDYVFKYPIYKLYLYHFSVISEMMNRKYQVATEWLNPLYRGGNLPADFQSIYCSGTYPEHNNKYLIECKKLLKERIKS